jgi:Zn-dependent peptidase ImmA (M78 family)
MIQQTIEKIAPVSPFNTPEEIRAVFTEAAQRMSLSIPDRDVEYLARRVSLSLHVQSSASKLSKLTSQMTLRPSIATAVDLASRARHLFAVGDVEPLLNLPSLLADQFNVVVFPVMQKDIAGGCAIVRGNAFIFVSNPSAIEALFTCAHELAHLFIMSAKQMDDIVILDSAAGESPSTKNPHEHFADAFASALLIPVRGLGFAIREIRKILRISDGPIGDIELLYLSRIFGVSFLIVAKRCERAELLPKGGAMALYKFLVDKFGGPERRAEELELPPRPSVQISTFSHQTPLFLV